MAILSTKDLVQPRTTVTRRALLSIPLLAGFATLGGCSFAGFNEDSPPSSSGLGDLIAWPEKGIWPAALTEMPQQVQDNYHAAVSHKDLLQYIPCYCGCYVNGHKRVYDCYVAEERDDGSIVLDTMSFG